MIAGTYSWKRRALLVAALGAVAPGLAVAEHEGDNRDMALKREVAAAYAAWDRAFARIASGRGDMNELLSAYTSGAQLLPAGADPLWGREGVRSFFQPWVPNSGLRHHLELLNAGGRKSLLVFGTARWSVTNSAGQTVSSGYATHVFERQTDGRLLLRVHSFHNR